MYMHYIIIICMIIDIHTYIYIYYVINILHNYLCKNGGSPMPYLYVSILS